MKLMMYDLQTSKRPLAASRNKEDKSPEPHLTWKAMVTVAGTLGGEKQLTMKGSLSAVIWSHTQKRLAKSHVGRAQQCVLG